MERPKRRHDASNGVHSGLDWLERRCIGEAFNGLGVRIVQCTYIQTTALPPVGTRQGGPEASAGKIVPEGQVLGIWRVAVWRRRCRYGAILNFKEKC
jgi:hypothetical protein